MIEIQYQTIYNASLNLGVCLKGSKQFIYGRIRSSSTPAIEVEGNPMTEVECAVLVKTKQPNAKGALYKPLTHECTAEFGYSSHPLSLIHI